MWVWSEIAGEDERLVLEARTKAPSSRSAARKRYTLHGSPKLSLTSPDFGCRNLRQKSFSRWSRCRRRLAETSGAFAIQGDGSQEADGWDESGVRRYNRQLGTEYDSRRQERDTGVQ
ncbi:serine-type endopeptidase [Moniliophthora roreri]|nr:serine-type endopeptidase [Moniliophthora roreri]